MTEPVASTRAARRGSHSIRRLLIVAGLALAVAVLGRGQGASASHPSLPAILNTNAAVDSTDDTDPRLATDGAGNWVAVWSGATGTNVARSSDNGQTWTAPAIPFTHDRPEVTTDGVGNWVIVAASGTSVLASRSTDNGATWVTAPALGATESSASARLTVAAGGGTFMAAWQTADLDADIRYARSTDGGATWSAATYLNTDPLDSRDDTLPSLATDGAGGWVAVWTAEYSTSITEVLRAQSGNGGLSWSSPYTISTYRAQRPSVALSAAGIAVAVWQVDVAPFPFGHIRSARSVDGGLTWSAGPVVSDRSVMASNSGAAVVVDASGRFLTVWAAANVLGSPLGSDEDMLTSYSLDGGVSWSRPGVLNTNAALDTAADGATALQARGGLATGGGSWIAAWASKDTAGSPLGTDSDILYTDCIPVANDSDADSVGNQCDNCPTTVNATQRDFDDDGLGDACDEDQDADGICEISAPNPPVACVGVDACPNTAAAALITPGGCADADVDPDLDGHCTPLGLPPGPSGCLGPDNCPLAANPGQEDANSNGIGDACEAPGAPGDSDGDGWADAAEAGVPLCSNTMNDDHTDDGLVNDGCPAFGAAEANCANTVDDDGDGRVNDGCPRSGAFAEGQFNIGTIFFFRCGVGPDPSPSAAWPPDLNSSGSSQDAIKLTDITSFVAPMPKKLNTNPGDAGFNSRWDLVPGPSSPAGNMIALNDLTSLVAGPTNKPPMFGGGPAWHGPACTAHPIYGD